MSDLLFVSAAVLIEEKPLERVAGTVCDAAYVDVVVSGLSGGPEVLVRARIDTGADITCVPRQSAEELMPLLSGRSVLIRGHDGSVCRASTYLMVVRVPGWPDADEVREYRPRRGVVLTDSDVGLIGMDIIREWDLSLGRSERRFSVVVL